MVTGDSSALSVNSPAFSFSCTFCAAHKNTSQLICTVCWGCLQQSQQESAAKTARAVQQRASRTSHKTAASRTALHAASSSPLYPSVEFAMVQSRRELLAAVLICDLDTNGCTCSAACLGGARSGTRKRHLGARACGHTDIKRTQAPGVLRQRMPVVSKRAGEDSRHWSFNF